MPRNRKVLLNKKVVFLTTSVEEGLPFAPNPLINMIICSALARAQYLHPVCICHYLFESNHLHLILIVDNPDDVAGFMERFKTETAHAINKLLGRKKKTIWCDSYDSPMLLTPETVIQKIVYLYTNPTKDNLEDSIDRYPGLSSWRAFRGGKSSRECPRIRRDELFPLASTNMTLSQYQGLARRLKNKSRSSHTFRVCPDAWMEAFGIEGSEIKQINESIFLQVREKEAEYRELRSAEGGTVIGSTKLMLQPIDTAYTPCREGRKMWVLSTDKDLRKECITWIKSLVDEARRVYGLWKEGDFSCPFPPGLFPPSMPKLANCIPLV
jgi:REP element-mobilizing transposase RayT